MVQKNAKKKKRELLLQCANNKKQMKLIYSKGEFEF